MPRRPLPGSEVTPRGWPSRQSPRVTWVTRPGPPPHLRTWPRTSNDGYDRDRDVYLAYYLPRSLKKPQVGNIRAAGDSGRPATMREMGVASWHLKRARDGGSGLR